MHEIFSILGLINLPLVVAVTLPIYIFCSNHFWATRRICNSDRVLVITGCDSGIGLQLAKWSLEWGYHVVACCLDLTSTGANMLRSLSVDVLSVDVRSRDLVQNMSDEMTRLQKEGKGRVINVSSPQGMVSSPFMSVYCASKWGVEAFSHALRREIFVYDVKVVILRPCNFPHKTSILKRNSEHLAKMKSEMSNESLQEFGEEMETIRCSFESTFSNADTTESINDPHLMRCFRSAVESRCPARSYTAAPLIVRVLLEVLTSLPDSLMDKLVQWNVHNAIITLGRVA